MILHATDLFFSALAPFECFFLHPDISFQVLTVTSQQSSCKPDYRVQFNHIKPISLYTRPINSSAKDCPVSCLVFFYALHVPKYLRNIGTCSKHQWTAYPCKSHPGWYLGWIGFCAVSPPHPWGVIMSVISLSRCRLPVFCVGRASL